MQGAFIESPLSFILHNPVHNDVFYQIPGQPLESIEQLLQSDSGSLWSCTQWVNGREN